MIDMRFEAIEMRTGSIKAGWWLWLGRFRSRQKDFARALLPSQEALKLNPNFQEAWHNLGQAYLVKEHIEQAVNCFEKVFQLDPGIPETINAPRIFEAWQ